MTENTSNFYFFHHILFAIKLLKIFFAIFIHQKPQETNIIAIFFNSKALYLYILYFDYFCVQTSTFKFFCSNYGFICNKIII